MIAYHAEEEGVDAGEVQADQAVEGLPVAFAGAVQELRLDGFLAHPGRAPAQPEAHVLGARSRVPIGPRDGGRVPA